MGVGLAIVCGVALGMWLPRRLIRRRVDGDPVLRGPERRKKAGSLLLAPADHRFAADLSGALALALGLLLAGLFLLLANLEGWRGWLIVNFLHPPAVTRILVAGVALAGCLVVAATSTILLSALHGWRNLYPGRHRPAAELIHVVLGAAAGGAIIAAAAPSPAAGAVLSLTATFAAGFLAVWRSAPTGFVDQAAGRQDAGARPPWLALVLAAGTMAGVGAAVVAATPPWPVTPDRVARGLALLAAAALVGVLVGRSLLHHLPGAIGLTPWLSAVSILAAVGTAATNGKPALMAISAVTAAVFLVPTWRLAVHALRRPQRALTWLGVATAAGTGVGLTVGGAVLPEAPAPIESHHGIRHWLEQTRLDVAGARRYAKADAVNGWDIDLGGPAWQVVLLEGSAAAPTQIEPATAARLLRRCRAALLPGGHLVIAPPAGPLAVQALGDSPSGGSRLRLAGDRTWSALLVGPDVAAWLEHVPPPGGAEIDWLSPDEADRLEAAPLPAK